MKRRVIVDTGPLVALVEHVTYSTHGQKSG
ncbi:MAG: hypothetical protein BECKG1743D_GA0114223_110052 [Candidatus Kentron sp. G]|nr:MAG: hypothetical protein BECKG1743F_GA0114225_100233 [Candidatus Kentron sp. G]VFN06342.1 MAG: hypothetical protein BECKG1743E_GA0114224_110012 [Candidatus Kentron sp. G]VFN07198.1 MAG: hypothetical protein BECKG1743D_GA0114223_110052 [Candidatus Kentron sp. G]